MSSPTDNLQQLESLEQQLCSALQSAGHSLVELAKEKPSVRQVENHSTAYMKALDTIEGGLSTHINYLTQCSTGQPHEGSCYAAQNDLHMARFRWEHVRSRLNELEKMKTEHLRQQSLQRTNLLQNMKRTMSFPSGTHAPSSSSVAQSQSMDTGTTPAFGDVGMG